MKIDQQYMVLVELKKEIDEKLKDLDFQKIKELILWLTKSENYQRLKTKENQLSMLDFFCSTWIEEKRQMAETGVEEDIFAGVRTLKDIENKYSLIKFGLLRLETSMPTEYYEQVIDTIIDFKVSGIAIGKIAVIETLEKEKNIIKIAQRLRDRGQVFKAMTVLRWAKECYPQNKDIILELTDCWIAGGQWKCALECLKQIDNPELSILELIEDLENNISYEKI